MCQDLELSKVILTDPSQLLNGSALQIRAFCFCSHRLVTQVSLYLGTGVPV